VEVGVLYRLAHDAMLKKNGWGVLSGQKLGHFRLQAEEFGILVLGESAVAGKVLPRYDEEVPFPQRVQVCHQIEAPGLGNYLGLQPMIITKGAAIGRPNYGTIAHGGPRSLLMSAGPHGPYRTTGSQLQPGRQTISAVDLPWSRNRRP